MNKKYILLLILLISIFTPNVYAYHKTETIYATFDLNGKLKKNTIQTKLQDLEKGTIEDYSYLNNLKNIGKEQFTKENNKILWKSTGKDITYEGKISKDLPISVNIKYYLNGKETKIENLNKKKGNIKIIYNFTNNDYNNEYNMLTPYVVTIASIYNEEKDTNIKVSNGKIINNGKNIIITAISSPGLYNNTKIEEFKNLDKIEINYNTTSFSPHEIYCMITPKILDEVDLNKLDQLGTITSKINTLQDGMNELVKGSVELSEKEKELSNGLSTLKDGMESISIGSKEYNKGQDTFTKGLIDLNNGIEKASSGMDIFSNSIHMLTENSNKIDNIENELNKLYETYKNNKEILNNIDNGTLENEITNKIEQANIKKQELNKELIETNSKIMMLEQLNNPENEETIKQLQNGKIQIEEGIKQIDEALNEATKNSATLPLIKAKIEGANEVIETILINLLGVQNKNEINDDNINILINKINSLKEGIIQIDTSSTNLSNGLQEIKNGSNKIIKGNETLSNGSKKLEKGIEDAYNGTIKLEEGSKLLYDGSKIISEGLNKVNNDGINQLTNTTNKINKIYQKMNKLVNISKNYKGFLSPNTDEIYFIYKISE